MQTRLVIGKYSQSSQSGDNDSSSFGGANIQQDQFNKQLTKDFESSEGLLDNYETLKQTIEIFLLEKISNVVLDGNDRIDLANFRINCRIKSKKRQKPIPLRDESDFTKLVELVKEQNEGMLVIKLDTKKERHKNEKKYHKKERKEKRKRFEESDEEIDNKKKEIKLLADEIKLKKIQMQNLQSELGDLKDFKKGENQIIGLMDQVSLDSQPKENNSVSTQLTDGNEFKKEKHHKKGLKFKKDKKYKKFSRK